MIANIYCRSDGYSTSSRETCVTLVSDAFVSADHHLSNNSNGSSSSGTTSSNSIKTKEMTTDINDVRSIGDINNVSNSRSKQIFTGAVVKGMLNGTSKYVKRPSFMHESNSGIVNHIQ